MKRFIKLALPIVALAAGSVAQALDISPAPYAGVDAQIRTMKFAKGGPDLLFAKNALQGNVFVGAKLNEYFGVELGYEQTKSKKRDSDASYNNGDVVFNELTEAGDYIKSTNKHQIKGFSVSILGYLPLVENQTTLYAGVGLARLKMKATFQPTGSHDEDPYNAANREQEKRSYKATKIVPKLTAGVEHMLTKEWGIRGNATWENTARFKKIKPSTRAIHGADASSLSMKNSVVYGIGVFYKF